LSGLEQDKGKDYYSTKRGTVELSVNADTLAERRRVSMRKLEIVVNVLVLVVTLAACGAVGVELAAAAGAVTKVESAMVLRTWDADFIRHNYGTMPWAAKAVVDTKAEVAFRQRAQDADFLRHNCGANPWDAKVDTRQSLQTLDCHPNEW
jgi:hypothetical protein